MTLYAFTYYSDDADLERERAQEARTGGRAILRYYADTRPSGLHWTIALRPGHGNALDKTDSDYQRRARASRDNGYHSLVRSWWPIMQEAFAEVVPTCDICGGPEDQDPTNGREYDWNGETGNHLSCERP